MNAEINELVSDLLKYMGNDLAKNWYAGISNDANRRLFGDHAVDKDKDLWKYKSASSEAVAREVEKLLLGKGFQGGDGGGDHTAKMVYIYKVSTRTNP